ncbi:hypothetical protein Syun_027234 [Stephania yunnanensis]|uniref:Uncharacterized protein n=1 Tax=Stephania yunnanensis TaxID=152371 RepID=A0AAP0HKV8_9MAGN
MCVCQDLNNFDSDPEEFARTLCKDLDIRDAEVAQLALTRNLPVRGSHETCSCSFVMVFTICGKGSGIALDLVKLFGGKSSVIRKRKEWDLYEPIVDLLSNEEVETLDAREERNARAMMAERGPISRWLVLRSSGS